MVGTIFVAVAALLAALVGCMIVGPPGHPGRSDWSDWR